MVHARAVDGQKDRAAHPMGHRGLDRGGRAPSQRASGGCRRWRPHLPPFTVACLFSSGNPFFCSVY